jgi:hypothetical protein
VDTTAPTITITGSNPATVEKGAIYSDAGATTDADATVSSTDDVDTTTVGDYTVQRDTHLVRVYDDGDQNGERGGYDGTDDHDYGI